MCNCFKDSSGNHQPTCPQYNKVQTKPTKFNPGTKGWTCPRCGHIYAPSVIQCYHCNGSWVQPWIQPWERNPWRRQFPYLVTM